MRTVTLSVVCWLLTLSTIILRSVGEANSSTDLPSVPTVRVAADTIWIVVGGQRFPASLKQLRSPDTTGFGTTDAITVIGTNDTLVVKLGSEPFEFLILWRSDTIHEVFLPRWSTDEASFPARAALLRRHHQFGSTVPPGLPAFTYESPSDSTLALVRREFALDSIAGAGDDIARALRLMHWLHENARWDGSKDNPKTANSRDMLVACTREGKTANCGGMAGMLTTLLLAEGFKARQLICRPYDTADQECHSVNIVYSSARNKWVLIDPTHDACFQDTARNYLSPMELRQTMANGDSIVVPAGINLNGVSENRMSYLGYLAKNLFRFSCWQEIPGKNQSGRPKYAQIFLNPVDYQADLVGTIDSSVSWYTGMFTDDSSVFWIKPQ
ncbi:MAG: transglutaminase domain-containing protein [candidate division Zixibacteria bacterium]|nr:transglutaminase domain-containing protein [candidate division Zixibacteria bacterium]